jgi:DNA-binding GntR family transcriptional regulator
MKRDTVMSSADVAAELRGRVLSQELPPGARLPEERLAGELGCSRAAVRAALASLEAQRLVERIPNAGVIVSRMDPGRLLEIYDVLELLEGLAARLAAQRATPADWEPLQRAFSSEALDDAARDGDLAAFMDAIDLYRGTVERLAANSFLSEQLNGIRDQAHALRRRILMTPGRMAESLAEHRAIIAALAAGDAPEAERLKRLNMQSAARRLTQYRDFLA